MKWSHQDQGHTIKSTQIAGPQIWHCLHKNTFGTPNGRNTSVVENDFVFCVNVICMQN